MIEPNRFFEALADNDVGFFSGVPDSLLKSICAYITDHTDANQHVIAANEGNAVALGIGYHLATGSLPLVYMQNSGLGNVVNPLLSLADPDVYAVPMLMMIGWRGEPDVKDEPQHKKQGRVTTSMLDSMEVPYHVLGPDTDAEQAAATIAEAVATATRTSAPVALLIRKNTFGPYKLADDEGDSHPLSREEAVKAVTAALDARDIVVSTTGVTSRELFEHREAESQGHERDFLTVGGMGHASQIAVGIAMHKPDRQVFCLDGDGAMLMHMGALAVNAHSGCRNFRHVVFNNAAHDSVGGQPTVGELIDVGGLAESAGYTHVIRASSVEEITAGVAALRAHEGIGLLEIKCHKGFRADLGRPTTTPLENKRDLMGFIAS